MRNTGILAGLTSCAAKRHMLLDGPMGLDSLKEVGRPEVFYLVSTDDEASIYKDKVNRLATIQEHYQLSWLGAEFCLF